MIILLGLFSLVFGLYTFAVVIVGIIAVITKKYEDFKQLGKYWLYIVLGLFLLIILRGLFSFIQGLVGAR